MFQLNSPPQFCRIYLTKCASCYCAVKNLTQLLCVWLKEKQKKGSTCTCKIHFLLGIFQKSMSLKKIWYLKCKFYAIFLLLENTSDNFFQPKCEHVSMFTFLAQVRGSWNFNQKRKLVLFIGKGNFWKETIPSLDKQIKIGRFLFCERISNDFHCLKPRSKIFDMEKLGL